MSTSLRREHQQYVSCFLISPITKFRSASLNKGLIYTLDTLDEDAAGGFNQFAAGILGGIPAAGIAAGIANGIFAGPAFAGQGRR